VRRQLCHDDLFDREHASGDQRDKGQEDREADAHQRSRSE